MNLLTFKFIYVAEMIDDDPDDPSGEVQMIQLLLDYGADIHYQNPGGRTALMIAGKHF